MYQLIDWQLLNNNEVLIDLKDAVSDYKINEYLIFNEENETNRIDITNKMYERKTKDYSMIIDFKAQTCKFVFPNNEECLLDIDCHIAINDDKIYIQYRYDEEIKEIKITLKEVK